MNKEESKISNTEWGLVIGALLMIDLMQMVLEWLIIGLFINWIIDMFVGMSFALYLQLRGQSLANPKRLFGLIGTFFAELIPVVDELPLWCLDGIFNMIISKSDKTSAQVSGEKSGGSGDALDQLNNKPNRTREDNVKLTRAMYIMKRHSISESDKSDPVYLAAWNKVQAGIEAYSPVDGTGYRFNNVRYSGG